MNLCGNRCTSRQLADKTVVPLSDRDRENVSTARHEASSPVPNQALPDSNET